MNSDLQRCIAGIPRVSELAKAVEASQRALKALDISVQAARAEALSTGVGVDQPRKRGRLEEEPSQQTEVDGAIAQARFVVESLRTSEGQLPEDRLESALEVLRELRDVPVQQRDDVRQLIEELEAALRPAMQIPGPSVSQSDLLAMRSVLLGARQLLSRLRPESNVDGMTDEQLRELIRQMEGQRERLASAQARVVGDSDLASEADDVDLSLREAIYRLESYADARDPLGRSTATRHGTACTSCRN